jgi:hypothetical protein
VSDEKLAETICNYINTFKQSGIPPVKHADDTLATDYYMELQHCHWMLLQMEQMNNREKTVRWLGFIQGVLWTQSIYTINKLKGDNRDASTEVR